MSFVKFVLMGLICVSASCELWANQQLWSLPDASVEEIMLKRIPGATRDGKVLKLRTDVGPVTFEDRIGAGEDSVKYYLAGFMNTREYFFLIRKIAYESKGYVLVDKKSGQSVDLYGMPVFSPDGKKFVDVSLDLEAGYMPNLIHIYELKNDKYTIEWKHVFKGRKGPSNPVWLNNSALVFFEVTFDKVPAASNLAKKPFIVEFGNSQWNKPRPLK